MASSINPADLARPRGYSHGMMALPGCRLLAIAGQIAWDQDGRLCSSSFAGQFTQALRNVVAVLRSAGGGSEDVLSLRIYVTDKRAYKDQLKEIGAAYREIFGRHYPAMALI